MNARHKVNFLFLVEHVARELDVACVLRAQLVARGKSVETRHIYLEKDLVINTIQPLVVVTPFFYRADDLAIKEYVVAWPKAKFFNLAWEEIFYEGHKKLKAPSDSFAQQQVTHQAWGKFYRDYLMENGVEAKNIFVNGNPVYQLYKEPYRRYFPSKAELAQVHGLDSKRRWLLIPENYNWAFITTSTILWRASRGGNYNQMLQMRSFARRSLKAMLSWCATLATESDWEIIIRPKPATGIKEITQFFSRYFPGHVTKRLHFIKAGSVREWILASDMISSSFSTTLIEAAIAEKPIVMVEPEPLIQAFQADWYDNVPRATTYKEFKTAILGASRVSSEPLRSWAAQTMLAPADCLRDLGTKLLSFLPDGAKK